MKKNARSRIATILVAVLLISLLACNTTETPKAIESESSVDVKEKADENVSNDSDAETDSNKPYEPYPETVTMGIGKMLSTFTDLPDGRSQEDNALTDYVKEKLNLDYYFAIEAMGAEAYLRQVSLAIASGELPDVMAISDKNVLDELVENDLIADLTDVFNEYAGAHMSTVYDTYGYPILDRVTYDGKMMALPRSCPEMGSLVWIRQDWLDDLGIKVDKDGNKIISRDELEMVAKEFIAQDPGGTGNPIGISISTSVGESTNQTMNVVNDSFNAFPGRWLKGEDGTVYNGTASPEMKDALQWWADMFEKGILDYQYGVRTQEDITAMLINGNTGITFGEWTNPAWQFASIKEMNPEADFTPFCLDNGTNKASMTILDTSNIWFVVRKDYEHPEALIKLANLMAEVLPNTENMQETIPEIYEYMQTPAIGQVTPLTDFQESDYYAIYGVKAVEDYFNGNLAMDDINNATTIVTIDAHETLESDPTDSAAWGTVVAFDKGINTLNVLDEQGMINWVSPLRLGTTETMNSRQADLNKLEEGTIVKIITGELSVDEYDSFIEEWKARGGAQIAEELADRLH